jgi:hypothetical protein
MQRSQKSERIVRSQMWPIGQDRLRWDDGHPGGGPKPTNVKAQGHTIIVSYPRSDGPISRAGLAKHEVIRGISENSSGCAVLQNALNEGMEFAYRHGKPHARGSEGSALMRRGHKGAESVRS